MSNERTLKKIFNTKPEGTRSVGRPKLRWEDGVVQDTRILGVNRWNKTALDRDEWAKLLKSPGSTKDCRANDDDEYMAKHKRGDAGVPDGTTSCTPYYLLTYSTEQSPS